MTQFEAATAATFVALAARAGEGGGDRGRPRRAARRDQHDPLAGHRPDLDRPRPHRVAGGDRARDRRREAGGPARPLDAGAGAGLARGRGAGRARRGRARRPAGPRARGPRAGAAAAGARAASSAATSPWRWRPPRRSSASSTPSGSPRSPRPFAVPGRLERIAAHPPTYVDAAHNPDGAAALAEALPGVAGGRRVVACLAILADKDAAAMVGRSAPALERAVCTELPADRRASRPGRDSPARRPAVAAAELAAICRRRGAGGRGRAGLRRGSAARASSSPRRSRRGRCSSPAPTTGSPRRGPRSAPIPVPRRAGTRADCARIRAWIAAPAPSCSR